MLLADLASLIGVAMYYGLKTGNATRSMAGAIFKVLVLPWLGFGIIALACGSWTIFAPWPAWDAGDNFYLGVWVVLGILADLYFGGGAWRQLLTRFGHLAEVLRVPSRNEARRLAALDRAVVAAARGPGAEKQRWFGFRRRPLIAAAAAVGIGAVTLWFHFRPAPHFPHLPPVIVQLGAGNTPIQISSGGAGALMVLTDGSLWLWGRTDGQEPRTVVPQPLTGWSNWLEAGISGNSMIGITRDGGLWQWGDQWLNGRPMPNASMVSIGARQLSPNSTHGWARLSTSFFHYLALMDDGTLWAWGRNSQNELGNGAGPDQPAPVRVGADHDWADTRAAGEYTLALRKNGPLWAWGRLLSFWNRQQRSISLPTPTQFCTDTNWVGFFPGNTGLVVNRAGEVWMPYVFSANGEADARENCRLVFDHYVPGRFAFAYCGGSRFYQVRNDGTLWRAEDPVWNGAIGNGKSLAWTREGKRTDWTTLWSGGGAAFGLTTDGTLWTWGADLGREPVEIPASRTVAISQQIAGLFSSSRLGTVSGTITRPFESEPWPLMKLVPTGAAGAGR